MAERSYGTDAIRVRWRSDRCIHSAICLDALPEVFDARRRPWVDVTAADADRIADTIRRCPTSALTYERLDGVPQEEPDEPTTITPTRHGPLYVRGRVDVRDEQGNPLDAGFRAALCRCGHSRNQPFCDLSHRLARFRSSSPAIAERRERAESPDDISQAARAERDDVG